MQQNPVSRWLEELKQAMLKKWEEALENAKEGVKGCVLAPFRFVWNVIVILWQFTWRLFWILTGTGCLVSTPIAVLAVAVFYQGTGWLSIPLTLVALPIAAPLAFLVWLLWVGFKKLLKWLFTSKDAIKRKQTADLEKAKTLKILFGCLLITTICGPIIVITGPIMIIWGIKALINAIRERRENSEDTESA